MQPIRKFIALLSGKTNTALVGDFWSKIGWYHEVCAQSSRSLPSDRWEESTLNVSSFPCRCHDHFAAARCSPCFCFADEGDTRADHPQNTTLRAEFCLPIGPSPLVVLRCKVITVLSPRAGQQVSAHCVQAHAPNRFCPKNSLVTTVLVFFPCFIAATNEKLSS